MILGIGIDASDVGRVSAAIERRGGRFVQRLFTAAEISYCEGERNPAEHFAARFAAKEAVLKALGTGRAFGLRWREVEVERDTTGRPSIRLTGAARRRADSLGTGRVWVSLATEADTAWAVAVLESAAE